MMPDKWLKEEQQTNRVVSHSCAGFTEYIRWMRSPLPEIDSRDRSTQDETKRNKLTNNQTKLQILQLSADRARSYTQRLKENNERTKLIAGENNIFEAECPWRVRVGGETGAENILLPAFDSLGIPYIPSASLRGVARSQAFWEISQNIINDFNGTITNEQIKEIKQRAEQEVSTYFGSLDIVEKHRMGKVIFLDAYPKYNQWGLQGRSLALDIATNIWGWEGNEPKYSPNPNTFLSLNKPQFIMGLRPRPQVNRDIFEKVKGWLIRGLQHGIGSQVNSGYGEMMIKNQQPQQQPFLEIRFNVQGQLIHGVQKYKNLNQPFLQYNGQLQTDYQGNLKPDTCAEPEVRPIAFKSMLRYWFRTLALGYLPANMVQNWENQLFGGIQPQQQGWIKCQLKDIYNTPRQEQLPNIPCLQQEGTLKLSYSREIEKSRTANVTQLMTNLTWLMFHLGGVGQGARRPLYSRLNRANTRPPYYRGCNLTVNSNDDLWKLPDNIADFQQKFHQKLKNFYLNLFQLTGHNCDVNVPLNIRTQSWQEAIDANCCIIICTGDEENDQDKPHALAVLHCDELNPDKPKYNSNLCGISGDRSPVWISNLRNYQVVTVFGANTNPRNNFIRLLKQGTDNDKYYPVFPLN